MSFRAISRDVALCAAVLAIIGARPLHAQANVPGIRGDWGLKAGSQMAPGTYLGVIYDWYSPDKVIDENGVSLNRIGLNQNAVGLFPAYVASQKIWSGARWGAYAAIPWANAALNVANANITTGWSFSDIYVQPLYLGWTLPMADITAGAGMTLPTGRYSNGATDNTGLGMWSVAFDAGTTVYAGTRKEWNLATLATFQMQSSVKDSDKRAGNALSLEGGLGHSVLKGIGNVGLAYYTQWKVSNDRNFPILTLSRFDARDQYYAIGPEITAPLTVNPMPVILTARYFFEMGNRVATQGNQLIVFLTLAKPTLPGR